MFKNFMKLIFLTHILYMSTALTMKNDTSSSHQNKYISDNPIQSSKRKKKFKSACPREKQCTVMRLCCSFQRGVPKCSFDVMNEDNFGRTNI